MRGIIRKTIFLPVAVLALADISLAAARPASAESMPRASVSIYVNTTSTQTAYNEGCAEGALDSESPYQNSEAILDFGGQDSADTGTILFDVNHTIATYAQDVAYGVAYANGYYACTGSDTTSRVLLALGTNNSAYQVSNLGGKVWANYVVKPAITDVANDGFAAQVAIESGNDIEPNYSAYAGVAYWVQGYASEGSSLRNVDFGSADGCPTSSDNDGGCLNGWSQFDVWYVSYGLTPLYALPEIYEYAQAQQWTQISGYGYNYSGSAEYFDGPLSENGYSGSYTTAQSWDNFLQALTYYTVTTQNLTYVSDI